jgi:hypothetical protein
VTLTIAWASVPKRTLTGSCPKVPHLATALGILGVFIALVAVFTDASTAFLWLGFVVAGVGASLAFYVKWGPNGWARQKRGGSHR